VDTHGHGLEIYGSGGWVFESPQARRGFDVTPCSSVGPSTASFGSLSPDRTSSIRKITFETDPHNTCGFLLDRSYFFGDVVGPKDEH
jgi:hypothetical protein